MGLKRREVREEGLKIIPTCKQRTHSFYSNKKGKSFLLFLQQVWAFFSPAATEKAKQNMLGANCLLDRG